MIYTSKTLPPWFRRLVIDWKNEWDVDPLEFPAMLAENGVRMEGFLFVIDDAVVTFAELKYRK